MIKCGETQKHQHTKTNSNIKKKIEIKGKQIMENVGKEILD